MCQSSKLSQSEALFSYPSPDFSDELGGQCGRLLRRNRSPIIHKQRSTGWISFSLWLGRKICQKGVSGPIPRAGRVNDRPIGKSRDSTACLWRVFGSMSHGHPPLHHDCPECSRSLVLYVGSRLIPGEGRWSHPCRKMGAWVVCPCLAAELW